MEKNKHKSEYKEIAMVTAGYYMALRHEGFTEDEAMEFTKTWILSASLAAAMKGKDADKIEKSAAPVLSLFRGGRDDDGA